MVFSFSRGGRVLVLNGIFLLKVTLSCYAQVDSIPLKEVAIKGFSPVRYMAGSYVQSVDSTVKELYATRRLDELLSQYTSLAFRSYGNGQLATVAFRGLAPSHTAVVWNGININLPSVGQTDFASISTVSTENIKVQYGAGSSNLGSDAVAGSILLESMPLTKIGFQANGAVSRGSFQNQTAHINTRYRLKLSEKWHLAGKSSYNYAHYPNRYPSTTFQGRRLEHSITSQLGFTQDLYLENRKGNTLSGHVWMNQHDITLRPNEIHAREFTGISSFRAMVKYGDDRWNLSSTFIRDKILYGTGSYSQMDHSVTDRYGIKAQREFQYRFTDSQLSLLTGLDFNQYQAKVNGYDSSNVAENRTDLYVLTRWQLEKGLIVSGNFRQAINEGYKVPFTPSLGVELPAITRTHYKLGLSGSVGKSYRVPTLNERYWKDLGNPTIQPESGLNLEAGLSQTAVFFKFLSFQSRYNLFRHRVDNWVYWNPSKSYRAENLQQVLSRGIELHHHFTYQQNVFKIGIKSLLSYTRSTQEKAYDTYSEEILGRQLRFVPVWVSNLNAFFSYKQTHLTLQHHFESLRYINEIQYLPPYHLLDLLISHQIRKGKLAFMLQTRVANLTNQLYLNIKSNAMPGRSFHFTLHIQYN